jgi:DNA end-binding protein Ku
VREDRLALTTMLFGDEIRPSKDVETGGKKPSKQQLEQATALIEALSGEWDPGDFEDRYRARLKDVVARKRKGKRISAPKREKEPAPVPDLMAALERSLAEATGRGKTSLGDLSREELYERAQERDVPGRSSMSKDELVKALGR